jgi:hypothetical protein
MGMIVKTNSEIWTSIYYNLRDYHLDDSAWVKDANDDPSSLADALARSFLDHGIRMIRDGSHSGWTHVELPDGEDLIELVLRWG